jgi:Phosphatidylglycerophosphate synthase
MNMRNLPTIITSTRFILAGIIAWLLCYESNLFTLISVILFVAGSLSDALDGAIARRQETLLNWGLFFDHS